LTLSLMLVWRRGRAVALARRSEDAMPLDLFIASLSRPDAPIPVPGAAVYLTTQRDVVPSALALNLKHNGVLHRQILLLKVTTERATRLGGRPHHRGSCRPVSSGWSCALASPRSRMFRQRCAPMPRRSDAIQPLLPSSSSARYRLPRCNRRCRLAGTDLRFMVRNAVSAPDYFLIAPQWVVELETKVEI
jgi:KUP system potassium uptake protein